MDSPHCRAHRPQPLWPVAALALIGCASPGLPRPPSLNLPEPVRDLTATRIGDTVELRFTVPARSTDKLPLRGSPFTVLFCRELDHQPCVPLPSPKAPLAVTAPHNTLYKWTDSLPPELIRGPAHTLGYRVEVLNPSNHSAGTSAPAFTATGPAPPSVEGFHAEGSRLGVVLRWTPAAANLGAVTLLREDLTPKPAQQLASPGSAPTSSLVDTTASPATPYRYIASRSLTLPLGGRSIEIFSAPSSAVDFTLKTVYPPLAPAGLTAAAFFSAAGPSSFAVDLIWQPVDEPNVIVRLAGYNLYREPLADPSPDAPPPARPAGTRLNATPLPQPSFHDTTANPATRYRYSVTAIDTQGNESGSASAILDPSTR